MLSFNEMKKFVILGILALISLLGLLLASRPKNEWVCRNGTWVADGKPAESKPFTPCK